MRINKVKMYLTQYNGDRPYKVLVDFSKKVATVFDRTPPKDGNWNTAVYDRFITNIFFRNVYIGKSNGGEGLEESQELYGSDHTEEKEDQYIGNTILFEKNNGGFIFVGDEIKEFDLLPEDSVVKYHSPVGHSNVPYPSIQGKHNWYDMLEGHIIPLELFEKEEYTNYSNGHAFLFSLGNKPLQSLPKLKLNIYDAGEF